MRGNQYAIIKGRLVGDAKLESSTAGKPYIKINIAVNEKEKNKDGKLEEITTFYNVLCFDKQAEIFSGLKKGDYIRVEGRLSVETYKNKKDEAGVNLTIFSDEMMKSDYLENKK